MEATLGVFVDVQNIFLSVQMINGSGRINFNALLEYIRSIRPSYNIKLLNCYTCYDPNNDKQRSFMLALGHCGWRVVSKPLKKLPDGSIKANMDMEMAVDALCQAQHCDEIILVTGDGDFKALIDVLVSRGKKVTVIGPDKYTSPELILASHEFVGLGGISGLYDLSEFGKDNTQE